jgi:hypothetical protein
LPAARIATGGILNGPLSGSDRRTPDLNGQGAGPIDTASR